MTGRTRLPCLLLWLAAAPLLLVVEAPPARAHGGNFRLGKDDIEGGDVPPSDVPAKPDPVVTDRPTWLASDWRIWWRLNRGSMLPDKRALRRRVTTASPGLFEMGRSTSAGLGQWERELDRGADTQVLPFLLELVDPRNDHPPALVAAALLAVGRTARDATPLRVIREYAGDAAAELEVRESAVLALGLLRRSQRGRQLDAGVLSGIRSFLFALFDDKDAPTRVRAFAALAVGFLADQPYPDTALERDGRRVTQALWLRLERKYPSADLPVALLTALGRQPRAGVPSGVLEGLRTVARGKPLRMRKWDDIRRSHALSAFVRLDGPGWLPLVLWILRGTHDHAGVRSAAAIALAQRAADLDPEERKLAARSLRRSIPREPHWFVRGLDQLTLAALLHEDLRRGSDVLIHDLHLGEYLCAQALDGRSMTRPYAALAVGLSVQHVTPRSRHAAVYLKTARNQLLRGLRHGRGADDVLGAYAVGLGLAQADAAHKDLLDILRDRHRGASLRGHCAVALAQIGRDTREVREALQAAASERVSPLVHIQAVRALAILATPGTTQLLLDQLEKTRARHAVAVIAAALGHFGDPAAAAVLVARAGSDETPLVIRTMCVVALGLIFDPESRPSRVLLTTHANYPSRTDALTQVFNIQ